MTSRFAEYARTCAGLSAMAMGLRGSQDTDITCESVVAALNEFQECVRYLNTRRSGGAVLRLESEADVQDAIYLMLRPWLRDLVPEDPTDKTGNRYTIKDFLSSGVGVIIEAKYIRDRDHGRLISKELHDDIETYKGNRDCRDLIFFAYDPDSHIPDVGALKSAMHMSRVYDGRPLHVTLIVKP